MAIARRTAPMVQLQSKVAAASVAQADLVPRAGCLAGEMAAAFERRLPES